METTGNRREWQRLTLTEDALVLDDTGFELGRVAQVSGGGMLIYTSSEDAQRRLAAGRKMCVSIQELTTKDTITMNIEVVHTRTNCVGVRFV